MAKPSVLELLSVPPALPSEYRILTPTAALLPRDSQKYLQFVEADAGKIVFNPTGNDAPEIQTKCVTMSGVAVVLENSSAYPLFSRLNRRTDLRYLTIAADEVIVRSPVELPGTEVTIHARILRFEGKGSFNTTPPSIKTRASQALAANGAPAGSIYLYVKTIDAPGSEKRFIANGADGQPAQLGEKGDDGRSLAAWNGKISVKNPYGAMEEMNWEANLRGKTNGYTVVHVSVLSYFKEGGRLQPNDRFDSYWGDVWPGNGAPPKRMPGTPGRGGAGGDVYSRFQELLAPRTEQKPGQGGAKAEPVPPSLPGTPVKSCAVQVHYESFFPLPHFDAGANGNGTFVRKLPNSEFKLGDTHDSTGHPQVAAPEAPAPDRTGRQAPLCRSDDASWLHALAVQAFVSYLRDAWRAGQTSSLRALTGEYLAAFASLEACHALAAAETPGAHSAPYLPIDLLSLEAELKTLLQQIDSPLDHFGHPAGWVPVLSFESNYAAFEAETRDAMARLYLSYWIEHNQATAEARAGSLQTTLEQLKKETDAAIKAYNDGETDLVAASQDYGRLSTTISDTVDDLERLEAELQRVTKTNLEHEKLLRGAGKLLGGIAQIIPVGQPALGAVGTGLTALADWDTEKPWDSVKQIGSAVWKTKLVSDKLLPKVQAGAQKLLELKVDEEKPKDDFKKEVEKQELTEKAKKHIKDQGEAKEQVTKALGSFSVSKDELEAAMEKAIAKCPEYAKMTGELKKLNASKAELAERLLAIARRLDDASHTVVNNRLTEIELRSALATAAKALTPEGLRYTRAMGQRALERLQRYEYYFLKSYMYLWLETPPSFDLNSEYIFKALAAAVQPRSEAVLSGAQYERLGVVFRENLKSVADRVLTYYNTVLPEQNAAQGKFTLELSAQQLAALNSDKKSVVLDPMAAGKLHLGLEDVRIFDVKVVKAELIDPPASAVNIRLRVKHPGESTLRRNGRLFLFRNTARNWGALVTHADKRTEISAQKPDPMDESLIRTLMGQANSKSVLRSRASAWSTLVVERELMDMISSYPATFSAVTIEVHYTARDVNENHVSLFVNVPRPLEPIIACSPADLDGHGDGAGRFMRTYHRQTQEVTLTAPESHGEHAFMGWRVRDRRGEGEPNQMMPLLTPEAAREVDLAKLVRTPTLRVALKDHQLIEAVYAQRAR